MRRPAKILTVAVVALLLSAIPLGFGCGEAKGVIDQATYGKIQNGMTMDDVSGVAGQPERSHRLGSANATPQIVYWYYGKTAGEGLVRVELTDGKVTGVSPWDANISPDQ